MRIVHGSRLVNEMDSKTAEAVAKKTIEMTEKKLIETLHEKEKFI